MNEDKMQQTDLEVMIAQLAEIDARAREGKPQSPPPDLIAFYVQMLREILGWKQDTLGLMAGVSLSTVERVERGASVSSKSLDRIAVALGQPPGSFTTPRLPLSAEETLRKMEDSLKPFDDKICISVRPVRGQRQVAKLASSHFFIADDSRLSETCTDDARGEIACLVESLNLVSFIIGTEGMESIVKLQRPEPVKRRKLYGDVLVRAGEIERRTNTVILAGVYDAETDSPLTPKARVTVIGLFPRSTDPAAISRRALAVPARISIEETVNKFCAESRC